MAPKHSYKIEQSGENFVLIETSGTYGQPVVRVPYSIQQEADSGVSAAALPQNALRADRRHCALGLVRRVTQGFIASDMTASSLLALREDTEKLITLSLAEIRKSESLLFEEAMGATPAKQTK